MAEGFARGCNPETWTCYGQEPQLPSNRSASSAPMTPSYPRTMLLPGEATYRLLSIPKLQACASDKPPPPVGMNIRRDSPVRQSMRSTLWLNHPPTQRSSSSLLRAGAGVEPSELVGWAGRSSARTQPAAANASNTAENRRRRTGLPRSADNRIESILTVPIAQCDLSADAFITPSAENKAYP